MRVFDEAAIKTFLATKPEITVVTGSADQTAVAQKLADALNAAGCKATVADEKDVIVKATYPRVFDPNVYLMTPRPKDLLTLKGGDVKASVTLETGDTMATVATTRDDKDLGEAWHKPYTLATTGPGGWIDYSTETFYAAGCKLYIDKDGRQQIVNAQQTDTRTTDDFRRKWSRPWTRLSSFIGTDKVPPQLPEAYRIDKNLIVLGDSDSGQLAAALQASEVLPQVVDEQYPGDGRSVIEMAWSPFMVDRNVIFIGAADPQGLEIGASALLQLLH